MTTPPTVRAKAVGRARNPNGRIHPVELVGGQKRFQAFYRSNYIGTFDTAEKAQEAIEGKKARAEVVAP